MNILFNTCIEKWGDCNLCTQISTPAIIIVQQFCCFLFVKCEKNYDFPEVFEISRDLKLPVDSNGIWCLIPPLKINKTKNNTHSEICTCTSDVYLLKCISHIFVSRGKGEDISLQAYTNVYL